MFNGVFSLKKIHFWKKSEKKTIFKINTNEANYSNSLSVSLGSMKMSTLKLALKNEHIFNGHLWKTYFCQFTILLQTAHANNNNVLLFLNRANICRIPWLFLCSLIGLQLILCWGFFFVLVMWDYYVATCYFSVTIRIKSSKWMKISQSHNNFLPPELSIVTEKKPHIISLFSWNFVVFFSP